VTMAKRPELVVGLDIGTAKVAAVVADPLPGGQVAVVGIGTAPCDGLRKGVVVNVEATVQAIASAVKEAEVSAGCEIHNVVASVGGAHLKGFNSHGVVAVRTHEVSHSDVERVLEAARAVVLPALRPRRRRRKDRLRRRSERPARAWSHSAANPPGSTECSARRAAQWRPS